MTTVIDLHALGDVAGAAEAVARTLAAGGCVGLPSECTYALSWRAAGAASATASAVLACRVPSGEAALLFRDAPSALDVLGPLAPRPRRLAGRCWPGLLILEFPEIPAGSPLQRLPEATRQAVSREGRWRIGVPRAPLLHEVLRRVDGPLAMHQPERPGELRATAASLAADGESDLDMLVDDGPVRYDLPATSVQIAGVDCRVVVQGIVTSRSVQRMAGEIVMFVCTGNTCRSPMAEGVFRRRLAERLGCTDDEVLDHGYAVLSAGLAALPGAPASREAVELLADREIDLHNHESRPATPELLRQADRIIVMARSHRDLIHQELPDVSGKVRMLSPDGRDVADPIGGGWEDYRACLAQIERGIEHLLADMCRERS